MIRGIGKVYVLNLHSLRVSYHFDRMLLLKRNILGRYGKLFPAKILYFSITKHKHIAFGWLRGGTGYEKVPEIEC